jgi:hypothetical protein
MRGFVIWWPTQENWQRNWNRQSNETSVPNCSVTVTDEGTNEWCMNVIQRWNANYTDEVIKFRRHLSKQNPIAQTFSSCTLINLKILFTLNHLYSFGTKIISNPPFFQNSYRPIHLTEVGKSTILSLSLSHSHTHTHTRMRTKNQLYHTKTLTKNMAACRIKRHLTGKHTTCG